MRLSKQINFCKMNVYSYEVGSKIRNFWNSKQYASEAKKKSNTPLLLIAHFKSDRHQLKP